MAMIVNFKRKRFVIKFAYLWSLHQRIVVVIWEGTGIPSNGSPRSHFTPIFMKLATLPN